MEQSNPIQSLHHIIVQVNPHSSKIVTTEKGFLELNNGSDYPLYFNIKVSTENTDLSWIIPKNKQS